MERPGFVIEVIDLKSRTGNNGLCLQDNPVKGMGTFFIETTDHLSQLLREERGG
jgi:hypothetical protein